MGIEGELSHNRSIRIFISSTFKDMIEDRNELMSHTWPQLRKLCQERYVEMVEVDLRWGIAEEQSTRKETLKLCLDEIHACRPFFIGLLGERYGWVPEGDAYTPDLLEEQKWLKQLKGKSVTELEILHGVLNNPEMQRRAFFYFRDPTYVKDKGKDFLSEPSEDAENQDELKAAIRTVCKEKNIPLREDYPDPETLADMVLKDLAEAINEQYPEEQVPDSLIRQQQEHEAFAEIRRRTYIPRSDYYDTLNRHAQSDTGPLVVLGDSGSGKSALLANWIYNWRNTHPEDYVFQHYIGGTADSADHWKLMTRLMAEIKRWTDDPEEIPTNHDDLLRDFAVWLAKAKSFAAHKGVRFIVILDALNQLGDQDHAKLLGWLPDQVLNGPLRLITSTLPAKAGDDDPLEYTRTHNFQELSVNPMQQQERAEMIDDYLSRFGKKLDQHRINRLASAHQTENPLYLKILLDDLRVMGTHDRLDERLSEYLVAQDIPALLQYVISRWQRDYEKDCPGLVSKTLGLIYAARRGLSEAELLQLLSPEDNKQLPAAIWAPFRAALEQFLVDRSGILNFAHDYLRMAVKSVFVPDLETNDELRIQLADSFETHETSPRKAEELPWLLYNTSQWEYLKRSLSDPVLFSCIYDFSHDDMSIYLKSLYDNTDFKLESTYKREIYAGSKKPDVDFLWALANSMMDRESDRAVMAILKTIDWYAEKSNNPALSLESLFKIGECFFNYGNLEKAEKIYLYIMEVSKKDDLKEYLSRTLYEIGLISLLRSDYCRSRDYLLDSIKYAEESNYLHQQARSFNILSGVYAEMKDFQNAHLNITRGEEVAQITGDVKLKLQFMYEKAILYQIEKNYYPALDVLEEKESLSREACEMNSLLNTLSLKGLILIKTDRFQDAVLVLQEGLSLSESMDNPLMKISILGNLALANANIGECQSAVNQIKEAVHLSESTENTRLKEHLDRTMLNITMLCKDAF